MYRVKLIGDTMEQLIDDVSTINIIDDTIKIKLAEWQEEDSFYLRPRGYKNIKTIEIEVY